MWKLQCASLGVKISVSYNYIIIFYNKIAKNYYKKKLYIYKKNNKYRDADTCKNDKFSTESAIKLDMKEERCRA